MKILVSGGAGFIGSNVVDGYVDEGHDVVVVDDLSSGSKENVNPAALFYHEDIRSPRMKEIFEKERPEILNHHAAQISVPASVEDPLTGERKDVAITMREGEIEQHVEQVSEPVLPEDPRPSPLNPFTILGVVFSSLGALGMVMRW